MISVQIGKYIFTCTWYIYNFIHDPVKGVFAKKKIKLDFTHPSPPPSSSFFFSFLFLCFLLLFLFLLAGSMTPVRELERAEIHHDFNLSSRILWNQQEKEGWERRKKKKNEEERGDEKWGRVRWRGEKKRKREVGVRGGGRIGEI